MAAPDLKTLFQFEGQLESAFVAVLGTEPIPAFFSHDTTEKPADHINVKVDMGAANGHVYTNQEWDAFAFRLSVECKTQRNQDEPKPSRHRCAVGDIRAALSRLSAKFSTGNLPYLQITKLMPVSSQADFDNTQNRAEDITRLEYDGEVAILNTAWPA